MAHKILTPPFIFLLLLFMPLPVNAVDLQHEANIQRLVTALETEKYDRAYEILQGFRSSGVEIRGELLYYESLAALSTKRDFEAFDLAEKYIEQNGRDAKHYSSALEIYTAAGENIDRKLAINSIENWNAASFELYIENRKTSFWDDFHKGKIREHDYFSSLYVDNKDGTISIYKVVEAGSNQANLYKFEMLSCPLGATYKKGACYGQPNKYETLSEASIEETIGNFSFAGHSDWRIPRDTFVMRRDRKSGFDAIDFFRFSPSLRYFDGQHYAQTHYGVSWNIIHPQAYLFNEHGLSEFQTTEVNTGMEESAYQIPQFGFVFLDSEYKNGKKNYCVVVHANRSNCDDPGEYMVIPVRGPELVGENLQVSLCSQDNSDYKCINYEGSVKRFVYYYDPDKLNYFLNLNKR